MLISNSIRDGIISHDAFLEILKEKKNIMVLRMKKKLRMFKKAFYFSQKLLSAMKTYCIVCKKDTENKNPKVFKTKNKRLTLKSICSVCNKTKSRFISNNLKTVKNKGRLMIKSTCLVCGNKKSRFILQGYGLLDSLELNIPQNRIKNALWNGFR